MITVFTSCFNQGDFLVDAIKSVLAQTYQDFEYILYDDGSTDTTWWKMQQLRDSDKRIRIIKAGKAANVGVVINRIIIEEAQGSHFVWCPADDELLPALLERKVALAKRLHPNTVIYSDWDLITEDGTFLKTIKPRIAQEDFAEVVWRTSPIGFTGIWIPRTAWDLAGPFPEDLSYSEDYYWMVKASIHGIPFEGIPEVLYRKRSHSNRLTSRNTGKIQADLPKIRDRLREYERTL